LFCFSNEKINWRNKSYDNAFLVHC
jgi:hypothetical protein